MKQLTCEMCGSTDLMKRDGVFICQSCGTKYSVEEAKKMMVEGTVEVQGTVKVDSSEKINNLYKIARREVQLSDLAKAKEYYDQILIDNPEDWEASFFSILGKAYGITRGEVPAAVGELVSNIPTAIQIAVSSTEDVVERRNRLNTIITHTVNTYTILQSNKVSTSTSIAGSIEDARKFGRTVVNCVSDMGYQIQKLGEEGMLGESDEWKKVVAHAFKWRTEYAVAAPAMFDEETRKKYVDELASVDPTYQKPEIKASPACYVATAVYGSYDCPQVWTLRRYRDYTLVKTWYGRAFVRTYYAISPTLVKWFGHTEWFKKMWKGQLDHMVANLNAMGVESTPYEDRVW